MKIGQLVRKFIPDIIQYCLNEDQEEISRLQDLEYSKNTFGISSYPFWSKKDAIHDSKRFWVDIYMIDGEQFRVSSQWTIRHIEKFKNYLVDKNIATSKTLEKLEIEFERVNREALEKKVQSKGRYRGHAIGNSQNLLVRNILSNLGDETFSEKNWQDTQKYFDNKCAYCGSEEKLVIEHAIPINKTMLGEHRLGNIVPSCDQCNKKKGAKSFDQFLDDNERIDKIKQYMKLKNYQPLQEHSDFEIIAGLLEKAYRDTADVSKRYIQIIELVADTTT